jgi:hypothetical protein
VTGCPSELRRQTNLIEAFRRIADLLRSSFILLGYAYVLTGWAEMKDRNTALRGKTLFGYEYVCQEQIPSTVIVMDLTGRGDSGWQKLR